MFRTNHWMVLDCVTGVSSIVEKWPFVIGSGAGVDLRLDGGDLPEHFCALQQIKGRGICLVQLDGAALPVVNGTAVECLELETGKDYTIKAGSHFLAVRGGHKLEAWRKAVNVGEWSLFDPETQAVDGPMALLDLCHLGLQQQRSKLCILTPQGLEMGFFLHQALDVFGPELEPLPNAHSNIDHPPSQPDLPPPNDQGSLGCPVCWRRFDEGELMHIAVHDSLRGDPILGPDAPLRYYATRFNHRRQALDPMGLPSTDLACPHCRQPLPPGFLDTTHHIFSIIGDQSAGKSYYLSVLIRMLATALPKHFDVLFQDSDPAGNAMLNDMKKTLFSAQTPEQARLVKTQLEGAMYVSAHYYGRVAKFPRPFVFFMASQSDASKRCSIIFYDNAGEHFQPGRDSVDSPGAQHVASSAGLFFLFDPFNQPEFRERMAGHPDPQLEKVVIDQQDVILSETKKRIKSLLNLDSGDKVNKPLAVLVGKCDAWMHLLGPDPFRNPLNGGQLDLKAIRYNSEVVRKLMLDICPTVVANAGAISHNVMYFPVSAFGHSPVRIGSGDYVPDPRRLAPILLEAPSLWALSQIVPELVPSTE